MARPWALAKTTVQPAQPGAEFETHHNRPKRKRGKKGSFALETLMLGWRPKLAMPRVGHATVPSAAIWFTVTAMARRTFLAPCPIYHRLIFVPKLTISLASVLFTTLSVSATVPKVRHD